jgi:hypothetical protein
MEPAKDFIELLELFNVNKVEYLVVGAYALAFHGVPRYTGDLDIFVNPDIKNAKNVIVSLNDFGFGSLGLTIEDFSTPNQIIQLGVPPVRIDLITSLTGIQWEDAYREKVAGHFGSVQVNYIGRSKFIKNKIATNRQKDLSDLEALGELK